MHPPCWRWSSMNLEPRNSSERSRRPRFGWFPPPVSSKPAMVFRRDASDQRQRLFEELIADLRLSIVAVAEAQAPARSGGTLDRRQRTGAPGRWTASEIAF